LSVRENASALELAVAELRHAVIRVVRTSTTEVDRRQATRYAVDLGCRLSAAGGMHRGKVVDLSETGAKLQDAPLLAVGSGGAISIDGVALPLPFVVRSADDRGALHVEFGTSAAARSAVAALLERMQQKRAA
jgi:methyl-accepting chemotaxis protein